MIAQTSFPTLFPVRPQRRLAGAVLLFLLLLAPAAGAASEQATGGAEPEFIALGIEDLMKVQVTSVSRKSQSVSDAAAAVFVITGEEIRRSGVTSIPEALRMVPGLQVARIDANKWAISSRGFNDRFVSNMLVLIDGRSVYTPLFGGVFWDRQDTLLEDIDRIEVIRGPGATMWGANAVTGVINIITKDAADTQGWLAAAGAGSVERRFGEARYGRQVGDNTSLRLYGKYTDRGSSDALSGGRASDAWKALRGGFRIDSEPSSRDSLTLQGDLYRERIKERYTNLDGSILDDTAPIFGANVLTRWKRTVSEGADLSLQLYYDRTEARFAVVGETRDTFDIDFQNRFPLGTRQEIVWGAGYRLSHDSIANTALLSLEPTSKDQHLLNSFLQDDVTLIPDRLHFIVGSKFEKNSYTGFETQPSARIIWTPDRRHTLWGAVSRAVRLPARVEQNMSLLVAAPPQDLPVVLQIMGQGNLEAETLVAYEAGYRVEATERVSLDLAAFYNVHNRQVIPATGEPVVDLESAAPHITVPMQLGNFGRARTWGAELAADAKPLPFWRARLAYSYLQYLHMATQAGGVFSDLRHLNPHHQVSLRSSLDLPKNAQLDLWLRYVDPLDAFAVGSYLTLDARLAWKPFKHTEIALVGQNLLQDRHQEFLPTYIATEPTSVPRGVYGKITWRY